MRNFTQMISEEIVHIQGIPKKLVVFLHGYLDSSDAVDARIGELCDSLPDFAVHIPQAPFLCEVGSHMRQWYSMYRFDPEYARKNAPNMEEFLRYYNRMSLGLSETHSFLQPYIEQTLSEYGLGYQDLFLCGFSQGAMAAIYTALMLPEEVGGLISFSGIMAGHEYLLKNALSHPNTLLLHGIDDNLLRPESLDFTAEQMRKLGSLVTCHRIKNLGHTLDASGIEYAIKFIKKQITQKAKR